MDGPSRPRSWRRGRGTARTRRASRTRSPRGHPATSRCDPASCCWIRSRGGQRPWMTLSTAGGRPCCRGAQLQLHWWQQAWRWRAAPPSMSLLRACASARTIAWCSRAAATELVRGARSGTAAAAGRSGPAADAHMRSRAHAMREKKHEIVQMIGNFRVRIATRDRTDFQLQVYRAHIDRRHGHGVSRDHAGARAAAHIEVKLGARPVRANAAPFSDSGRTDRYG